MSRWPDAWARHRTIIDLLVRGTHSRDTSLDGRRRREVRCTLLPETDGHFVSMPAEVGTLFAASYARGFVHDPADGASSDRDLRAPATITSP